MDSTSDGREAFLPAQERTAHRTGQLLVAARLVFVFSHGLLAVCVSVAMGLEARTSWWSLFVPAWLGDALCALLVVGAWFASCPYVQLCLGEHQARLGDDNPSILTDILPDVVMAVLGLLLLALEVAAELLLCAYLERSRRAEPRSLVPSATMFIVVSVLACCRGICIRPSTEIFSCVGGAVLLTSLLALGVTGGPLAGSGWLLVLPSLGGAIGLLVSSRRRLLAARAVLAREEILLRAAEQAVLAAVAAALAALAVLLQPGGGGVGSRRARGFAGAAGACAGAGVCALAALRARRALLEGRHGAVEDRLLSRAASRDRRPSEGSSGCASAVVEVHAI